MISFKFRNLDKKKFLSQAQAVYYTELSRPSLTKFRKIGKLKNYAPKGIRKVIYLRSELDELLNLKNQRTNG